VTVMMMVMVTMMVMVMVVMPMVLPWTVASIKSMKHDSATTV
jgi:hypothetical protein